ncbi:MAG TPA: sugar ABC transporter substrate-binding protein [Candidatus Tetragenococcus pullicola]|nr:sugar ABC transporter substrate-binding protein [Candidatus Tetragenococcus pullicola]
MKASKWINLTATLALSTLVIAGCGNSGDKESADGTTTIEFMHWGGDETFEGDYKERIETFEEENPDIKVKTITVADDYDTKLQTMIAGNEAPDVAQVAENGSGFATKGAFLDLSDRIEKASIDTDETWGAAIDLYKNDDEIFGLPDRGGSSILYYNKDMFDEANIDYPTPEWTMDDYYAAAEKMTNDEEGDEKRWGSTAGDYNLVWGNYLQSNGGGIMDQDGKVIIDSSENLDTLTEYNDAFKNWSVDYETGEDGVNRFQAGVVGMNMTGFWDIKANAEVEGLNFGISTMPIGTEPTSWSTGSALTISSQSSEKEQEAAWKFIQYMTDEDAQQILGKGLSDCPANLKVLSSDEFLNQKVGSQDLDLSNIATAQERVKIDGLLAGPWYSEANEEANNKIKEMLLGNIEPEEATKTLQTNLEKIVAKY